MDTMTTPYRVLVVGMGKRGMHHATWFHANDRFQLVGICDIDRSRLEAAAPRLGHPAIGTDAAEMVQALRPDVFCFATLPTLRLEMVKIGVASGARLIAFEKPVAMSSAEAMAIKQLLDASGVKAVVSHQHRYGVHYQKVAEIVASGALGRIHTIYASATGWMLHMLSHLIDYMRWYNGNAPAEWAMAQAAGRGKLADIHTSPDYLGGFIQFANGVRGIVECGAGAPDVPEVDYWWRKARISVYGTEGHAEVLTGSGWRAVTSRGAWSGPGCMNYDLDMPPYIQDMADWLDGVKEHPCNFASAYAGHEIMMALVRSVVEGCQVALPLTDGQDELALLKEKLPARPVLLSSPVNAREYLG
jgi:predicted dehydrogenase